MGLFNFLKKEEKKSLPIRVKVDNVAKALVEVSKESGVLISSLDFEIVDFKTYIKMEGDEEFIELDEISRPLIGSEEFLLNEENEIKQVYDIIIDRIKFDDDFEIIGEMKLNKHLTKAEFVLKNESFLVYTPDIEEKLLNELNKKKLKNSLLISIFDKELKEDVKKVVKTLKVNNKLLEDRTVRLCRGLDPLESIEGKVVYYYLLKRTHKKELIFPVKKGDVLIEIIKPKPGKNGRDCRGKIIKPQNVSHFKMPNILYEESDIKKQEDDEKILFIALKDGYVHKDKDFYSIRDEMEVKQINLKTGDVSGATDSNVKINISESDALKEAIADNMKVETTFLVVKGNVGNSAKIVSKELRVEGQTHQKSKIKSSSAYVNIHKGYLEGKDVEVNRLEGGVIIGKNVKVKQAIGGKIFAHNVEVEILGSHVEIYALNEIKIKSLKGSENKLIISPKEVLGVKGSAEEIEKKMEEIKRHLEIKISNYNKRKQVITKNKPVIQKLFKEYTENKKRGLKTPALTLKKIKEFNDFKEKTLELKEQVKHLQEEIKELKEHLQGYQIAIFNAKIISFSSWKAFNRIVFDMIEPPISLVYDTKGDEGVCGFKLKDLGDTYKIVKIKVKDDSSS